MIAHPYNFCWLQSFCLPPKLWSYWLPWHRLERTLVTDEFKIHLSLLLTQFHCLVAAWSAFLRSIARKECYDKAVTPFPIQQYSRVEWLSGTFLYHWFDLILFSIYHERGDSKWLDGPWLIAVVLCRIFHCLPLTPPPPAPFQALLPSLSAFRFSWDFRDGSKFSQAYRLLLRTGMSALLVKSTQLASPDPRSHIDSES